MDSSTLRRRAAVGSLRGVLTILLVTTTAAVGLVAQAPVAAAGVFLAPVLVGNKIDEPGIHVAPDGTLYIEGPAGILNGIPSASTIFRSNDDGATWAPTPPGLRALLPGGGDSTLAIAPNGDLAFADLWAGSSTVAQSADRADGWLAVPAAGLPIQDRPWLANAGGSDYLAYHQLPSGVAVSKSIGGGLVYPQTTEAATILDQDGCITCAAGGIIATAGGTALTDRVGVIFSAQNGGVKFSRSTNSGLTWTVKTIQPGGISNDTLVFPTIADAGGGRLVAVWLNVTDTRSTVMLATSTDWGDTWSATDAIVTSGTSVFPWVAAKGEKVAISLYWNASQATPDTSPADAAWYESYLESADFATTFSPLTPADPTPVKVGPICTQGARCQGNRELGDFQSVAIDNQGRADLAYNRSVDGGDVEVRFVRHR
ncbi:hypothetical protein DFR76_101830 [Nocardia pseudobrasiliensis]|uniref:BNR repeat protein n=2 Tax=Nocardia pseudobrasiliensis TaxID=45979 RepID=A0A370IF07_9NOCA|nr:hypothetical protein DFR76_101830 [Nocardia pseudobrasiliensis]